MRQPFGNCLHRMVCVLFVMELLQMVSRSALTGRALYDFVVHWFEITKENPLLGEATFKYRSKVLYFKEHDDPESSSALRTSFNA